MKIPSKLKWLVFALVCGLCLIALPGCTYRSYREGETRYTSVSLGTNQTVAPFSLKAGKRDDPSYRELTSQGLTNESTQLVEAAVSAAVRASKAP